MSPYFNQKLRIAFLVAAMGIGAASVRADDPSTRARASGREPSLGVSRETRRGVVLSERRESKGDVFDFLDGLFNLPLETAGGLERAFEDSLFHLGPVTVSDTRLPSDTIDDSAIRVPHNISIINAEQIRRNGSQSLPEILAQQEGLTYTDETGLGLNARVDLRGFGGEAKQALVLMDEMRAVEPFDNSVTWHLYPPEFFRRVQIQRGGGSTTFGEGALSGVIRLLTKEAGEKPKVSVEGTWGDFETDKFFVEAGGGVAGARLYLAGRYATTDGYRVNSEHESAIVLVKGSRDLTDRLRLADTFYFADNETGIPGPLTAPEAASDRRRQDPDGQRGDQFTDKLAQNQFTVVYAIEDWNTEISNVFGTRFRKQDSIQSFGGLFGGSSLNEIETGTFSYVAQGSWKWLWSGIESDTAGGVEWFKDDIDNPFTFRSFTFAPFSARRAIDRKAFAWFLENRTRLGDNAILQTGVRSDTIEWKLYDLLNPHLQRSKESSAFSPRIGVEVMMAPVLSAFASVSNAFKAPDSNTLIFETPNLFGPNPDIDSQIARHYEAGLRFAHPEAGSVRVTPFFIETKKEILFNDISNLNENFDTKRSGIEAASEIRIAGGVHVFGNYTYTEAEFDNGAFDGRAVPLVPENQWTAGISAVIPGGWELSLQTTAVSDRFALNDFNNLFAADDYRIWGARAGYRLGAAEFFVRAQNILGEEYSSFTTSDAVSIVNVNPAPETYIEAGFKFET